MPPPGIVLLPLSQILRPREIEREDIELLNIESSPRALFVAPFFAKGKRTQSLNLSETYQARRGEATGDDDEVNSTQPRQRAWPAGSDEVEVGSGSTFDIQVESNSTIHVLGFNPKMLKLEGQFGVDNLKSSKVEKALYRNERAQKLALQYDLTYYDYSGYGASTGKALCKYASGTNPITGVSTRVSLGCGNSRRNAYGTPSSPLLSAPPQKLLDRDGFCDEATGLCDTK